MALLEYLSSDESPLPELTSGYTKPTTVFYQVLSWFFVYSHKTAVLLYVSLFSVSLCLIAATFVPATQNGGFVREHVRGVLAMATAGLGAIVGTNLVAFVMAEVLHKPLSWFSSELSTVALYGPAALAGAYLLAIIPALSPN